MPPTTVALIDDRVLFRDENGLVFTQTPGDKAMFSFPIPGPNFGVGVSQQSVHPNTLGTTDYASALQDALHGFYP